MTYICIIQYSRWRLVLGRTGCTSFFYPGTAPALVKCKMFVPSPAICMCKGIYTDLPFLQARFFLGEVSMIAMIVHWFHLKNIPKFNWCLNNCLKGAVCLYVNAMPPRFSAWFLRQPRFIAAKISPAIDSNKSAPRPAQSPTLSPTKSAMTAGFRGSSSGMSDSTFPEKEKLKSKEYRVIPEESYTLASSKFDK